MDALAEHIEKHAGTREVSCSKTAIAERPWCYLLQLPKGVATDLVHTATAFETARRELEHEHRFYGFSLELFAFRPDGIPTAMLARGRHQA